MAPVGRLGAGKPSGAGLTRRDTRLGSLLEKAGCWLRHNVQPAVAPAATRGL